MAKRHKYLKKITFLLILLIVGILVPLLSSLSEARKPVRWRAKKTVVIDPGHGGKDAGARGPNGLLEKAVTLELAQLIQTELKSRFKVTLTRSDDYQMELVRRADQANHFEADLFISIHTGGSFQNDASGLSVYYFGDISPLPDNQASIKLRSWDQLQRKHAEKSRILAETLQQRLEDPLAGIRCQVDSAPLLVLRGADMPAVLIEVGTLTNADEERRLRQQENLTRISRAVAEGINDFFRIPGSGSKP